MKKVKLGIVGCGAVTQEYHLPASKYATNVEIVALVDTNPCFSEIARKNKIPIFCDDYREIFDLVDGVLIALPHNLHASVAIDFLKESIPVLCEKPMATSAKEAKAMLEASQKFNTPLAIGFMRRFYESSKNVKKAIISGVLGRICSFDFEEGSIYSWRTSSGFYFNKQSAGGGVLVDTGSHALDLLMWWLGSSIGHVKYKDDNLGGIEANCILELSISSENNNVQGRVELSRDRVLRNSYRIFGTNGWLEYFLSDTENISLHRNEANADKYLAGNLTRPRNIFYYFAAQLCDFGLTIAHLKKPRVDGTLPSEALKLMETCYSCREPIDMPWITSGFV